MGPSHLARWGRIKVFLTCPHSPPRLVAYTCAFDIPIHLFAGFIPSYHVGATSWLPATCEFPSTLPTRGGSTVPVSRPIACALPVPLSLCRIGSFLRQAELVSPIRFTSASKMVLRTHPHWWRKVRDSNPRAISDSRVSSAVLSASQPTFLLSEFADLVL